MDLINLCVGGSRATQHPQTGAKGVQNYDTENQPLQQRMTDAGTYVKLL